MKPIKNILRNGTPKHAYNTKADPNLRCATPNHSLKTMTVCGCLDGCHSKATYKEKINNNQIIITLGTWALVCCSVFFRKPLRYSLQPDIMLWWLVIGTGRMHWHTLPNTSHKSCSLTLDIEVHITKECNAPPQKKIQYICQQMNDTLT